MSNDPFTPIRQRLLAVLDSRLDAIAPFIAKEVVTISAWILPDMSVNAIEEAMADLQGLSEVASQYGRADIDDELEDVAELLRAELPGPNEFRLTLNFHDGSLAGGCADCDAADVAEALGEIVAELQRNPNTPARIAFTNHGVEVKTNL